MSSYRPSRLLIPDASVRLDSMPVEGRKLALTVDVETREQIARFLEITALERLEVALKAVRFRGGMRVTGRLIARVTQPSVVTLEPVAQAIEEEIDRVFLPGAEKQFAEEADTEVFVDLEGEDIPDHFDGNEADLSDLIIETLSLAIDPYPRGDGESLATRGDGEEEDAHPFAALKALKGEPNK